MATSSETIGSLQQVWDWIQEGRDRSITSLSEYTKKTMIMSRAYIEDSIAREDGITPIMKFVNQMLGGFVFAAVGLNGLISEGRTVRDMAQMISTEDFHDFVSTIKEKFGDKNVEVRAALEANEGDDKEKEEDEKKSAGVKEVKLDAQLFTGRLVEVKIANGKGGHANLYFYVQIMPYVTPSSVMEQFVTANYKPDVLSRWAKFKAGEIKFWKDFVFECDLVAKRRKALKADKEGILREIEDRKQAQVSKAIASKSFLFKQNHNSASSIIVVSRRTLDRLMKDNGLDYRREDTRQKIMDATMSLMLVVYDPNYNTVDLYMNGISNAGNYSIDQLKEATGKGSKDAVDLKTLMTIIGSGNVPRF